METKVIDHLKSGKPKRKVPPKPKRKSTARKEQVKEYQRAEKNRQTIKQYREVGEAKKLLLKKKHKGLYYRGKRVNQGV